MRIGCRRDRHRILNGRRNRRSISFWFRRRDLGMISWTRAMADNFGTYGAVINQLGPPATTKLGRIPISLLRPWTFAQLNAVALEQSTFLQVNILDRFGVLRKRLEVDALSVGQTLLRVKQHIERNLVASICRDGRVATLCCRVQAIEVNLDGIVSAGKLGNCIAQRMRNGKLLLSQNRFFSSDLQFGVSYSCPRLSKPNRHIQF